MVSNRSRLMIFLAVLLVLLLAVGWWNWTSEPEPHTATTQPAAADDSTIKVGLILSRMSADAPTDAGGPVGFQRQYRVLGELLDPSFRIYPIVDPGTLDDPEVIRISRETIAGAAPIDGGDLDALRGLDVIVASHNSSLPDAVVDAIHASVSDGTSFYVRMFVGSLHPGPQSRKIADLSGIREGIQYFNDPQHGLRPFHVAAEHPILGSLKVGDPVYPRPIGFIGTPAGIALLQTQQDVQGSPCVMIGVSFVGKGTVVNCPFTTTRPVPHNLEYSAEETFSVRTVKWLARQSRQAKRTAQTSAGH